MSSFQDVRGFPIPSNLYLKQNTPAIKFPQFQAKIPKDGIHAGQYAQFDFGLSPEMTPANSHGVGVMPNQVIRDVKDGLGMRVSRYLKKKTAYLQSMKIIRQLLRQRKEQYSMTNAVARKAELDEMVRALRNDVRGMTPEMAERYMQQHGRPNNRATDFNDQLQVINEASMGTGLAGMSPALELNGGAMPERTAMGKAMGMVGGGPTDGMTGGVSLPPDMDQATAETTADLIAQVDELAKIQSGISQSIDGIEDDVREGMHLSGREMSDYLAVAGEDPNQAGDPVLEQYRDVGSDFLGDEDVRHFNPAVEAAISGVLGATSARLAELEGEAEPPAGVEATGPGLRKRRPSLKAREMAELEEQMGTDMPSKQRKKPKRKTRRSRRRGR